MASIFDTAYADADARRLTHVPHRKIELQSPDDWIYLLANVTRAAREKLDRHFPPDAAVRSGSGADGGRDEMRGMVEARLDEVRSWYLPFRDSDGIAEGGKQRGKAKESRADLSGRWAVHPRHVLTYGPELEPFDTRLAQRIQSLSAQIEDKTLELANLRRTAPAETARKFNEEFEKQGARQDELARAEEEARMQEARDTTIDVGEVPRVDEVRRTWEQGTADLAALKAGLGSTVARMEKAQETAKVIEGAQ
nr:kinetochore protein mis14 [Quercus suber]